MAPSATAHLGMEEAQPQGPWDEGWEAEVCQYLGISPQFPRGSLGCAESPYASLLPDACPHGLAGCQGEQGDPLSQRQTLLPSEPCPGNSGYSWWGYSHLQGVRAGPATSVPRQSSWGVEAHEAAGRAPHTP